MTSPPRRAGIVGNALAVALLAVSGALSQPPKPTPAAATPLRLGNLSLVVSPGRFDALPVLAVLDQERLLPDRIIVQALDCGEAAFAAQSSFFRQAKHLVGTDPLGDVGEWSHARGIECWAALDLLQWWCDAQANASDPFAEHPTLQALNFPGTEGAAAFGKFASPFNPATREALCGLVRNLVIGYPDLDGLLLTCRLPTGDTLGFDEPSRAAYIRYRQVDPVDLMLSGDHPKERDPEVREYYDWRLRMVGELVGCVAKEFRAGVSRRRVAVLGRGDYYDLIPKVQARLCMDWLTWVVRGYADELLLEDGWDSLEKWNKARALLGKCGKPVLLTPLVTSRLWYGDHSLEAAWGRLKKHGASIQRVALDPYYEKYAGGAVQQVLREARQLRSGAQ